MSDRSLQEYLGRRLRRRRELLGLSLQAVAREAGTGYQQIHKYESGSVNMPAARLWKVAAALEVPVSYFFEGAPRGVAAGAQGAARNAAPQDATEVAKTFGALAPDQRAWLLQLANVFAADAPAGHLPGLG
jgi:transcriptional regulator with XRE-family HTH domain